MVSLPITEPPAPPSTTVDVWGDMDEDEPGELVDGRLEDEEVPTHLHEAVAAWLFRMLANWGAPRRALVFGAEHKIAISHARGRKPDITVYPPGKRLRSQESVSKTPPALVVEVLSPRPRDVLRDRRDKLSDYAECGIKLYLIVDPQTRLFELYELNAEGRYVHAGGYVDGKMTFPGCEGLELDLDALWTEVAWGVEDEQEQERDAEP